MSRRSAGSIQSRGEGRWLVQVTAGRDPATGKRRRLSKSLRGSKRDAERELAKLLLDVGEVDAAMTSLTVDQYLTQVWVPSLTRLRRLTVIGYESKIRGLIKPYLGASRLDAVTPYMLDRWLGDLARDGVSGHSALHAFRVLRTATRQAVRWRLLSADPTAAVTPPKAEPHDPQILSADQVNRMLDAFTGSPIEPAVVLALAAGLRRSEICGLTWNDIDFDAGTVTIRRGLHETKGGETWHEQPKSLTSRRTVSLPEWSLEVLKGSRGVGPVVTVKPTALSRMYVKHRDEHELPAIPLRDLRHTHATLALAQGVDVVAVSRRLGHSDIAVTSSYYLRPLRSVDEDAARRINSIRKRADDSCQELPKASDSSGP